MKDEVRRKYDFFNHGIYRVMSMGSEKRMNEGQYFADDKRMRANPSAAFCSWPATFLLTSGSDHCFQENESKR